MVTDPTPDPEFEAAPQLICVECGHVEADHIEQDVEIPGATMRRNFCEACDSFHEFVPDPEDL